MDDNYRRQLIDLGQKAQKSYDKTVLSVSGGALGVSFAFVTNFVDRGSIQASGWLKDSLEVVLLELIEETLEFLLVHPPADRSLGAVQFPGDPGHAPTEQEQRGDQALLGFSSQVHGARLDLALWEMTKSLLHGGSSRWGKTALRANVAASRSRYGLFLFYGQTPEPAFDARCHLALT